jgi:serine/threonine protein kinase
VNKLNMAGRMCNMGDGMNGQSIIQVKECFDSRTPRGTVVLCIVMEYVPQVLTTLLTAYNPFAAQPLGIRSLLSIAKQLMQAVMYLHDHGHVHCDIKPQNILYKSSTTEDGKIEIRLADFGSCIVDTGDCNDYIVTRPYRPPEVMLGVPLTSAADVWSCGCVIMELILGAPLFTSNDHFQLITAMVELLGVPTNMPRGFRPPPGTAPRNGQALAEQTLNAVLPRHREQHLVVRAAAAQEGRLAECQGELHKPRCWQTLALESSCRAGPSCSLPTYPPPDWLTHSCMQFYLATVYSTTARVCIRRLDRSMD